MDVIYFFPLEKLLFLSWNGAKKKFWRKPAKLRLLRTILKEILWMNNVTIIEFDSRMM